MSCYIREELRRVFFSKVTILTTVLVIGLMLIGMLDSFELPWSWIPELSVMYLFLNGFNEGMSCYLALLFPIIVAIPYATSFITDCQCGIAKYVFLRMKRRDYYMVKFIVNALVGGFILVIGPLVGLLLLLILKVIYHMPWIAEDTTQTVTLFYQLGINSPILMILILLGNLFLCGMVFATFALGISILIQQKYLTMVFPFLFLLFSGTVLNAISPNLYLVNIYNLTTLGSSRVVWLVSIIGYALIGTLLFFIGGNKIEERYT